MPGYMPARIIEHIGDCFVLVSISPGYDYDYDNRVAAKDHCDKDRAGVGERLVPVATAAAATAAANPLAQGQGPDQGRNNYQIMLTYAGISVWLTNLVKKCFVQESGNGFGMAEGRLSGPGRIGFIVEGFEQTSQPHHLGSGDAREDVNATLNGTANGGGILKRSGMVYRGLRD